MFRGGGFSSCFFFSSFFRSLCSRCVHNSFYLPPPICHLYRCASPRRLAQQWIHSSPPHGHTLPETSHRPLSDSGRRRDASVVSRFATLQQEPFTAVFTAMGATLHHHSATPTQSVTSSRTVWSMKSLISPWVSVHQSYH